MNRWVTLFALILGGCAARDPLTALPTAANSVPVVLWAEYTEYDGRDYRLDRSTNSHTGITATRYWLNWHWDPTPKTGTLEIAPARWVDFRAALKRIGHSGLQFHPTEKDAMTGWSLYVEYPDFSIRAGGPITESTMPEIETLRRALRELTDGKLF